MEEFKLKAQATYNAAADHYEHSANEYWSRFGKNTVERLQLEAGLNVLDVACGTGTTSIPAAMAVGPTGHVLAVDLADHLLAIANEKAKRNNLDNVEFRMADMTTLDVPDDTFDVITCVFGIFFVPDMIRLVTELWRMVRSKGKLAITTWGPDLFEPMYTKFDEVVRKTRPELVTNFRPWDRITQKSDVEKLFSDSGIKKFQVVTEDGQQSLVSPESWWNVVLGSGLRSIVETLDPHSAEQIRLNNLEFIQKQHISSITTNVIYGVANKD